MDVETQTLTDLTYFQCLEKLIDLDKQRENQDTYLAFCQAIAQKRIHQSHSVHFKTRAYRKATDTSDACENIGKGITYAMLKASVPNLAGKKVMHVACNAAVFLDYLVSEEKIIGYGLDLDDEIIDLCRARNKAFLEVGDARSLSEKYPLTFDVVIAHHFLDSSYIEDEELMCDLLASIYGALKAGGKLIAGDNEIPANVLRLSPFERATQYSTDDKQLGQLLKGRNYIFHKQ